MSTRKKEVASIHFYEDRPTKLAFDDLYNWVIWQFPRKKAGGLCGAVRPPVANHHWFPALIKAKERQVLVHGHLDQTFPTPNAAADWIASAEE